MSHQRIGKGSCRPSPSSQQQRSQVCSIGLSRPIFIRECVEDHKIRVPFVRTHDNLADFFTKVLSSRQFFPLRDKIMNVPRARGGVEPNAIALPQRGERDRDN